MEHWMRWLLSDCDGKWISTRCRMVHGWPHKNGEHCVSKDLGSTDRGCFGAKQGRWSDESVVGCHRMGCLDEVAPTVCSSIDGNDSNR